jgi:hypothetical protein
MATHAVCDDHQGDTFYPRMRKDRDTILLFLTISLMLCGTRIDS